jgi:serine/threonine protein kinase/tetratricopeptide (TPR) repeat protein
MLGAIQSGTIAASALPLQPGQMLAAGRYTVDRALSRGGLGALYLAHDQDTFDRPVVLKVLLNSFDPSDRGAPQAARQRFEEEARTLARLRHPAIPQIYAYFHDGAHNIIVMEYIEGHDLQQGLTLYDEHGGLRAIGRPYPREQVLRWGVRLCQALAYLASQRPAPLVHHDIKPANLMVERADGAVRLVDFGAAQAHLQRQPDFGAALQQSSIYGTPGYAPPEQYRGVSEPGSDVYALAATLYHLLTDDDPGMHPFAFPELGRLGALGPILRAALDNHVERRPTPAALGRQLEGLLAGTGPLLQAPDGSNIADAGELVRWCEAHWELARAWLYGTLPDQITAVWGQSVDAIRHHADRNAGLGALLRQLDPQYPAPVVAVDPPLLHSSARTLTTPPSLEFKLANVGCGYAAVTVQPGPCLAAQLPAVGLWPGQAVWITLDVILGAQQVGGRLSTTLRLDVEHGQALVVPVTTTYVLQAPDGSRLADIAELVAWCLAHWEAAKQWLASAQPDSLTAQLERWGYRQIATEIRALLAQRYLAHDKHLDQALALIDPQGYGAETPQIISSVTQVALAPQTAPSIQIQLTNSGRRCGRYTLECPPWITMSGVGSRAFILGPGACASAKILLDRARLPLFTDGSDPIRICDGHSTLLRIPVWAAAPIWRKLWWRLCAMGQGRALAAVAVCVALLIWWCVSRDPVNACQAALREHGVQTQGHLPEACARLKRIERSYAVGVVALQRGAWSEAQQQLEAVLAEAPAYNDVRQRLGEAYLRSAAAAAEAGLWDGAADSLVKLRGIDPKSEPALALQEAHPEVRKALEHHDRLARLAVWAANLRQPLEPEVARSSAALAETYGAVTLSYCEGVNASAQGEWQLAQRYYERVLRQLPPRYTFLDVEELLSESYYWAGVEQLKLGDEADAGRQFEAAMTLNPSYRDRVQQWDNPERKAEVVARHHSELAQRLLDWGLCEGWASRLAPVPGRMPGASPP